MKAPKFISNTPDDLHCVQASVGMVLSTFLPQQYFSMQDLEKLTGFAKGRATWEMQELLNYEQLGLTARVFTNSSYQKFADEGFEYLQEIEGPEVAQWSIDHTDDFELERKRAALLAKKDIHTFKTPTQADIQEFLTDDWLVMLSVNARKLNNKPGFFGHRVLLYHANKDGVTMHDPGLPPEAARKVDWKLLESAWADPNENSKILIAVRKA